VSQILSHVLVPIDLLRGRSDEAGTSVSAGPSAPVVTQLTNQGPLSCPEAAARLHSTSSLSWSRQLCPYKRISVTPGRRNAMAAMGAIALQLHTSVGFSSAHAGPEQVVQSPLNLPCQRQ
jgi:hypothetical protein